MANLIQKILGGSNDREIARLTKKVREINALEDKMKALSDSELSNLTSVFRSRLQSGESLDDILAEAFAAVREAGIRAVGQRAFDMQVLGGIVLHQGRIAEMKTGEGKTLTATLPAYLNALSGKGVHIVTVNDYLARYHSEWMGKVYRFMGMNVGLIVHGVENPERRAAYAADVTYGTNNEFGFDYLRDNMVVRREDMVQRPLNFSIVDEVDSILVDEARTPLIISGDADKSTDMYRRADLFIPKLREEDFEMDEKAHTVFLTEPGVRKAEQYFDVENLADQENTELNHYIQGALKAHKLMHLDQDYVVQNGQVVIVDEFTGRLMLGRRYSDGLHQAIEAKEGVKVERENRTLATITFQNYFRMYKKLSGMTGTAKTEEEEFQGIYNLDVVVIPTTKPMIRRDYNDMIYRTQNGKYKAVVEDIIQSHDKGQPVLVGTVSVEKSEKLSSMLKHRGVPHQVLNAKYHEREAEIIAQAGKIGAVTIATNMAGRGTDIMLGGNSDFLARTEMRRLGYEETEIDEATGHAETQDEKILAARAEYRKLNEQYERETEREHVKVVELGGLYIIGTERHESRRIDNQLRGRAGRQGDPGSSRFYLSLEDDLLRLFGSDRITNMVGNLGMDEDTPLEFKMLSRQIEGAQKKVESRNYQVRKHVLQYDDVMNGQREIIYSQRRSVLEGDDTRKMVQDMLRTLIDTALNLYTGNSTNSSEWDMEGLIGYLERIFLPKDELQFTDAEINDMLREELQEKVATLGLKLYDERMDAIDQAGFDSHEVERAILLRVVDRHWMDHIDAMDELRNGVGLRAYGQRDPVLEYKFEGFEMFDGMVNAIKEDTISAMFHLNVQRSAPQRESVVHHMREGRAGTDTAAPSGEAQAHPQPVVSKKTVGRNDPCPCGSGKKYKNCCLLKETQS